ncbi:MAG: HK97 family phage prohead protease [Candidatus Nitronauta litoralis]|uniref:HK97 family phage prohead protease n=1 Tax=Candidatus Nitronauta litoralis TaxID=2705533 RepID=A0A7T0FZE3_9BACT|nr:MAG: HK97 family phage prohead protease [Candidatus Nitronauta litoralis]
MEYKTFDFDLNNVEEDGRFQGYAATFGNVDLGGDMIAPGAFTETLLETQGGRVPILDHHNPEQQIGWNLEAFEDSHGLFVLGQLDLNVQAARERHSLMRLAQKVGGRTGLSIGFQTVLWENDFEDPTVRHLLEIQLMEYSMVTFPMNPQASVTAMKISDPLSKALNQLISTLHPSSLQ